MGSTILSTWIWHYENNFIWNCMMQFVCEWSAICFSAQYPQPLFSHSLPSGEKQLSPAVLESAPAYENLKSWWLWEVFYTAASFENLVFDVALQKHTPLKHIRCISLSDLRMEWWVQRGIKAQRKKQGNWEIILGRLHTLCPLCPSPFSVFNHNEKTHKHAKTHSNWSLKPLWSPLRKTVLLTTQET